MATILPLFAVPLFISDLDTTHNTDYLKNPSLYERMADDNGYYTLNKNVLDDPQLVSLKAELLQQVNNFAGFLKMIPEVEFYITSSWVVKHQQGDWGTRHYHSNSIISGVYYFDVHPDSGDIIFENEQNNLFGKTLKFRYHGTNFFNAIEWGITPANGTVVLFPSHLAHRIAPNYNSNDRYCIAFNVFIKGILGKGSKLSELELK